MGEHTSTKHTHRPLHHPNPYQTIHKPPSRPVKLLGRGPLASPKSHPKGMLLTIHTEAELRRLIDLFGLLLTQHSKRFGRQNVALHNCTRIWTSQDFPRHNLLRLWVQTRL